MKKAKEIELASEHLAWEQLSKIAIRGFVRVTEDRVESFLHVQRSIAETLEIYGKLYDRQCEQLQKLQGDVDTCAQPDLQAVRTHPSLQAHAGDESGSDNRLI